MMSHMIELLNTLIAELLKSSIKLIFIPIDMLIKL